MGKQEASLFHKELDGIKSSRDYEEGRTRFERLCHKDKTKYPSFIKSMLPKIENYLCFLKYPEKIRRYISTTNPVVSLNSRIERIRRKQGGYFQSVAILEINLMLQIDRLNQRKWKNPLPILKTKAYELLQLFNTKFYPETHDY